MRAHSRKRPALVTTSFSNSPGGRLRERRLYLRIFCQKAAFLLSTRLLVFPKGIVCELIKRLTSEYVQAVCLYRVYLQHIRRGSYKLLHLVYFGQNCSKEG